MTLQWATTSSVSHAHGVKLLVYAEAGTGKTMLCATAPSPVIISAESGLLSLQRANIERLHGANKPSVSYDIPVLQVTTLAQLGEAYMFLNTQQARQHFRTICIDSLSEVSEVVLANELKKAKDPRQAYGALSDIMSELIRQFRDIPGYHVYMSAKLAYEKDGDGITRGTVSMPGRQLPNSVPYMFDELFRLAIGQHENKRFRYLQTDGDLKYVAKDRSGSLALMEPPDLTHIFNKILGGSQ